LLTERFRQIGFTAAESMRTPPRHAALRDDPAALAFRLFRDHAALTNGELQNLFGGHFPPAGLLTDNSAVYSIDFAEHLYLLSDWPSDRDDEVLPAGETAAILFRAAQAVGHHGRTLDLCCGAGTLALLLRALIGTDVNPRAIQLARLNAEINGITGIEFREGSLFKPAAGERFDLIVCQPPFVPRLAGMNNHLFLHGGTRGDELAQAIIAQCAEHLSPGGVALVYSDWPLTEHETLAGRLVHPGLAAHLFASPMVTVESYCQAYGSHLTEHLHGLGVKGIRQCLAVLTAGTGIKDSEVLPHQWATIGELLRTYADL
jgi:SAM-dependent methyltransferase